MEKNSKYKDLEVETYLMYSRSTKMLDQTG